MIAPRNPAPEQQPGNIMLIATVFNTKVLKIFIRHIC